MHLPSTNGNSYEPNLLLVENGTFALTTTSGLFQLQENDASNLIGIGLDTFPQKYRTLIARANLTPATLSSRSR